MHLIRRLALLAAALTTITSGLSVGLVSPAAHADDEAKIEARVGTFGRNCKSAIALKFKAKSMADVEVTLAASLRASIDAGELSLADVKSYGLIYDFRVHQLPGKDPEGNCNTDGQGNVQEIRNIHN